MRAKFPGSIRQIGRQLQKASFTADSDEGFVVDRIRDEYLEARYFERVSFQQSITDPFGKTFVVERLEFRQVDFTITKTFPELELRMAPRGLKGFTSGLLKASEFSMELEQCTVELRPWISAIERGLDTKIAIRAAVASGIELQGGARAKIAITGPADVRSGLAELVPSHPYQLETVQIDYPFGRSILKIFLSSDSSLRYSANAPEEVVHTIRAAFQTAGGGRQ
jgi:hypothetical protein